MRRELRDQAAMYEAHNIEYFEILRRKDQEPDVLSCTDDRFFEPVELVEQGNGRNGLDGPRAALERSKTITRLEEGELVLVRYASGGGLTAYRTFRPKAPLQIREEELS